MSYTAGVSSASASTTLEAGMQVSKGVSLLKPLSSGGMGAVWLADHLGLKTRVVVKFMLGGLDSSDSARTRFSREAAAAAQVKSPHVVQMLDHGVSDSGVPFIVMEHLEGHDLGDEIEKGGAIDPAKVVIIVTQVAKALSKVHAAGLLHRDIKPDNIFLCAGEEDIFVKLLDFGIAKSATVDADGSLDGETKTGQIVGTPYYMSPEQVTAQKSIDHRSDLWALGVVAFEALTGQRPFDGPSFGALAVKIATGTAPPPTSINKALPEALDAWFARACAREPADRFASAKELAEGLRAAFEGVLSLPSVSSDSGQRGNLTSGTRASTSARASTPSSSTPDPNRPGAASGSEGSGSRPASPTFGLAATALDDSDAGRQVALGRSEGGLSVGGTSRPGDGRRSSPILIVLGALALTGVVVLVLVLSWKRTPTTTPTTPSAMTSVASGPASSPAPGSAPPPSASLGQPPGSAVVAAIDAGAPTPAPSPTRTATGNVTRPPVNGAGRPTPPVTASPTKPSADPPRPTPKPSPTDPDLF